ncbi:uncharacterized protein zp3c [Myxocyprinus asiaticus]|uniref:uncharacterized protein zp3c n=1 Tax=Myxocyprinus asiaticus TaxID=70543 RepID=UPI0022225DC8|nr:uncharacterized protein zp3c [Myxocyprinus asiaticus]
MMWVNFIFIVLLNIKNVADTSPSEADAEKEWRSVKKFKPSVFVRPQFKSGSHNSPGRLLELPEWIRTEASEVYRDFFKPEMGRRPVPEVVKSILLPGKPTRKLPSSMKKMVQVLCYLDKMYVRVLKSVFTNPQAWQHLTLGSCPVNNITTTHYYFLCPLTGCGINRREDDDGVTYSNTLCYKPPNTGLVVWELPFSLPIRCRYTKFHRSYKVGFLPKIMSETLYRGLQTSGGVTLTAMDASWNVLPAGQSIVIGQPICFEAQGPKSEKFERLYLNRCVVTSSKIHPMDKYVVVANYGCLVDSKNNALTKFYTTTEKTTVRMCFQTFIFEDMVPHSQLESCNQSNYKSGHQSSSHDTDQPGHGPDPDYSGSGHDMDQPGHGPDPDHSGSGHDTDQPGHGPDPDHSVQSQHASQMSLFLHCEFDLGPDIPTAGAKSCMFDTQTNMWTELYGDPSVCDCCDSTCQAPATSHKSMISSKSWDVMFRSEAPTPLPVTSTSTNSAGQTDLPWDSDYYYWPD